MKEVANMIRHPGESRGPVSETGLKIPSQTLDPGFRRDDEKLRSIP